jgi:hypothetical protein
VERYRAPTHTGELMVSDQPSTRMRRPRKSTSSDLEAVRPLGRNWRVPIPPQLACPRASPDCFGWNADGHRVTLAITPCGPEGTSG